MGEQVDVGRAPGGAPDPPARPHVVITAIDVGMACLALVLAGGLVAAVVVGRDVPVWLAASFGQIVAYYFGRTSPR